METGNKIGNLARKMHPDGVFGSRREDTPERAIGRTLELIAQNTAVIFEARFEAQNCLAKVDILRLTPAGWSIEEVKSSTVKPPDKVKPEHLADVTFQLATAKAMGIPVSSTKLIAIDSGYVWDGSEINPNQLLKATDITERCEAELPKVRAELPQLVEILQGESEPVVETNTFCTGCEFHAYCHQNQPRLDVVFLPNIRPKQVTDLRAEGLSTIDLIPPDHKVLTESRKKLYEAVTTGRPYISKELNEELSKLEFPAAFIDYETCSPAIPLFTETRPYQSLCFQWSAHLMAGPDSDPVHDEYLASGDSDPRNEFCETLWNAIKDYKSIVHYSGFEIHRVRSMAESGVPYAAELHDHIAANSFDLLEIVRDHVCYAEFLGRTSIKVVLPVLVPTLSYKELEIADGEAASAAFLRLASPETSEAERTHLRTALRAYCKQDTLAMVEIYRALCALVR